MSGRELAEEILAPVTHASGGDDAGAGEPARRRIVNVRIAYVFDVAQTDELPRP